MFHRLINVTPGFATDIIKACAVMNNFVQNQKGYNLEVITTITVLQDYSGETIALGSFLGKQVKLKRHN